jgi:hypothetical protein
MIEPRSSATSIVYDDARQGVTGHHVCHVLGWGLLGIVSAFVIVIMVS